MATPAAKRTETAQKRAEAARLRIAGHRWEDIAQRVGYASPGAACTAVTRALKQSLQDQNQAVEDLRRLTVARYEEIQRAYFGPALDGDTDAAKLVLKCQEGLMKLQGTAAPQQVETTVTTAVSLEQLLAKATAADLTDTRPDPDLPPVDELPDPDLPPTAEN